MPVKYFPRKTTAVSVLALTLMLPMSACDLSKNQLKIDRSTNSEVQDYRDGLAPREASFADAEAKGGMNDAPEMEPYVSDDTQSMKAMPLVSISVNQTVPLRDALFELAKEANYDVQLDPRITGSIIFTARNKPFDVVVDRICEIAGLRYKLEDDTLRIELDTPYSKTYKIDYLSFVRTTTSDIKTKTGLTGSGDGADTETGSNYQITTASEANFWVELDTNLSQILKSNSAGSYLKTSADPELKLTAGGGNPDMPPAPPLDESSLSDGVSPQAGDTSSYVSAPMAMTGGDGQTQVVNTTAPTQMAVVTNPDQPNSAAVAQPQAVGTQPAATTAVPSSPVLRVESLPDAADPAAATPAGTTGAEGPNAVSFTPAYSINKQAGIISVFANERVQRQVADYLQELRRSSTSQVLIEAKVLEVRLNDEFIAGIDWGTVAGEAGDLSIGLDIVTPDMNPTRGANLFSIGVDGNDFTALASALSRFGTVRALASPRLTVINNQSAILSVAKNTVYFELDATSTTIGSPPTTVATVNSEIKTVPEGVLINVLPSIDLDHGQVSMAVRPTVTRIDSSKLDPGALLQGVDSPIPEVNVQELDSVVRMKSGQAMVMGGLLEDRVISEQNGVPVLSETPMFGALFRSQNDRVRKTELVIFLKATIISDPSTTIDQTDKEMYRTFAQDRHPYKF